MDASRALSCALLLNKEVEDALPFASSSPPAHGFGVSPAAKGAKGSAGAIPPGPRQQQEALHLQSQSGHPCEAAANAPNRCQIPRDLQAGQSLSEAHGVGAPPNPHNAHPIMDPCQHTSMLLPYVPAIAEHCSAAAQQRYHSVLRARGHAVGGFLCMLLG